MVSAVQVAVEIGEDGNLVGHVTCPLCQTEKKLRVSQDRTGHWVLANIVSHMNRHLTAMCNHSPSQGDDPNSSKKVKLEPLDLDDSSSQYGANPYGFTMSMT